MVWRRHLYRHLLVHVETAIMRITEMETEESRQYITHKFESTIAANELNKRDSFYNRSSQQIEQNTRTNSTAKP